MYQRTHSTYVLEKEYLIIALVKAKSEIFGENFITLSELSEFERLIELEFNRHDINAVITSDSISMENFDMIGDVIFISKNCCYHLGFVPIIIAKILTDKNLIINFFQQLENDKLNKLKIMKHNISN